MTCQMFVITQCPFYLLMTLVYSAVERTLKSCMKLPMKNLDAIAEWLKVNTLSLNVKKTHYMLFTNAKNDRPKFELKIVGESISVVTKTEFIGIMIDKLNWQHQISYISCKVYDQAKGIGIIIKLRKNLNNESLQNLYYLLHIHIWCIVILFGEMHLQCKLTNCMFYRINSLYHCWCKTANFYRWPVT